MKTQTYEIRTTDGAIARATATRPYKAAWIGRDAEGNPVKESHHDFTTQPKEPIGTQKPARNSISKARTWTYERVNAIEK